MAADLIIKQHDTAPTMTVALSDQNGPIDLSAASSVLMLMTGQGGIATAVATMHIASAQGGFCAYGWQSKDVQTADTFNTEFEIHWADGTLETVPNSGYNAIQITPDLGP